MATVGLAGGGTAGHVNPMLAVAAELEKRGHEVIFFGTREGFESKYIDPVLKEQRAEAPAQDESNEHLGRDEQGRESVQDKQPKQYEGYFLQKVAFPRSINKNLFAFPKRFINLLGTAKKYIKDSDIDVLVGFGGYVSAPFYIEAHKMGVPIIINEQNAKPGMANKLGAKYSYCVAQSFPDVRISNNDTAVGIPLREQIVDIAKLLDENSKKSEERLNKIKDNTYKQYGLDPNKKTLLVMGGSLGAQKINQAVAKSAKAILESGGQIIHLCGKGKTEEVEEILKASFKGENAEADKNAENAGADAPETGKADKNAESIATTNRKDSYKILEYCDCLEKLYLISDLAVSRAGANSVHELCALRLPAIFVPLSIGNGEQKYNALPVVMQGGSMIVDNKNFDEEYMKNTVEKLLFDENKLTEMSSNMGGIAKLDSQERICDIIDNALSETGK